MLGIADKVDTKIGRMSFGQQQRVAMMRALVQPFDFILAENIVRKMAEKGLISDDELHKISEKNRLIFSPYLSEIYQ